MSNFKASLLIDDCSSIEVSCDCKKITFQDTSNYTTNDGPDGHDSSDFTSRTITITKGDGTYFYLITEDVRTNNPTLYPLSSQGISITLYCRTLFLTTSSPIILHLLMRMVYGL